MKSAAYLRARKLANPGAGAATRARALGVAHALTWLALLVVAGLVAALATTRGESRLPDYPLPSWLPRWVTNLAPIAPTPDTVIRDTGLYPIVAANRDSAVPSHRAAARVVEAVVSRSPTLRRNVGALLSLLAAGIGLTLASSLLGQARRAAATAAAGESASALRRQIHRQMYRLGQSAMPTQGIGPIIALFTREVNDVRDGVRADLERSWFAPTLVAGLVLVALLISWNLGVALLSLAGIVVMASQSLGRRARQEADASARDAAVHLGLLQEDLGLMRTVRVFGMEAVDNRRFDEHLENHRSSEEVQGRTEGAFPQTITLLGGVAAVLSAGMVAFSVMDRRLSPAAVATLLLALLGLTGPTLGWLATRRAVRQAGRSAAGLFEFLERRPELQQTVGAQFLPPMRQRITFENVTLEAPSGRLLLDGVSFEIPARTKLAIMGRDEDSKHALACLIPRLIDPKIGRVRVDGLDLRDVTLESIRAQVATVFQSDLVFSDSVFANIGLGDPSYGLPRIIEAAKVAHAHHFIQDLPHGYETIIGPLGHFLKPDEQYRLALARAYLHDPAIVIVEELAAQLDEDTKHLIDDTIARLAANRTLIFLPHRLSTIRACDHVIILHNGRIEASGHPRDLQGESKLFRHLQYVEFNQFATGEIEAGQMNA